MPATLYFLLALSEATSLCRAGPKVVRGESKVSSKLAYQCSTVCLIKNEPCPVLP